MNKPKLLLGLSVLLVLLARSSAIAQEGCDPIVLLFGYSSDDCATATVYAVTKGANSTSDQVEVYDDTIGGQVDAGTIPYYDYDTSSGYPCIYITWDGNPTTVGLAEGVNSLVAYSYELDTYSQPVRITKDGDLAWEYSYAGSGSCYLNMGIKIKCVSPGNSAADYFQTYETPPSGLVYGNNCSVPVNTSSEEDIGSSGGIVAWGDGLNTICNSTCSWHLDKVWTLEVKATKHIVTLNGDTVTVVHNGSAWSVSDSQISETAHN